MSVMHTTTFTNAFIAYFNPNLHTSAFKWRTYNKILFYNGTKKKQIIMKSSSFRRPRPWHKRNKMPPVCHVISPNPLTHTHTPRAVHKLVDTFNIILFIQSLNRFSNTTRKVTVTFEHDISKKNYNKLNFYNFV